MTIKIGFIELIPKLYPKIFLRQNVVNHHQINHKCHTYSRARQIILKRNVRSQTMHIDQTYIDTGQRYFHISFCRNNEKVIAVNDLEPDEQENPVIELPVSHDVLLSHLKQCSTVAEQMITLKSVLSLNERDRNERIALCGNIKTMFEPFFDDFKVQLYGSSVNEFGFKGCDMDMSFSTNVDAVDVMKTAFDDSEIPTIEAVLSGKFSPSHMSKLSPMDQLIFIHTVFLDYYKDSIVVPNFIKAYIPIVRFAFDKYNLKCDMTTANKTAIVNTKLLYLIAKFDDRVLPLTMTLRYWAKHVGLIGGGLMFNTYTVTLMVIYFLQNRNPAVIPPAKFMMSISDSIYLMDMNLSSLLQDLEKIPKSKNTETLEELLREFFFFYLYFDFTRVICPYDVTAVPRDEFCAGDVNKKFKMNTICVQDPAKLTHNVANLVDYKHCRKFALEMLAACRLLQNDLFWTPTNDGQWGLFALLERPETLINFDEYFAFEIPLCSSSSQSSQITIQKASNLVQKILKDVLLFKCEDCLPRTALKECENDSLDSQCIFWLKCKGVHNTWLGRNCAEPIDPTLKDPLERERSISLSFLDRGKDEKKKEFSFACKCYILNKNDYLHLNLKVSPFGKVEFSSVLGIFLREYIPKLVKSLL